MSVKQLNLARKLKRDEFYTQLVDIENELKYYEGCFLGKVVYCNCDDLRSSNFYKYFKDNFVKLGLKKLISTCYIERSLFSSERAFYGSYDGENEVLEPLKGDGDFRSLECISILRDSDIVVTNPPFSLFRAFFSQLIKYNKKFLILGNINAIVTKDIFNFISARYVWLGYNIFGSNIEFNVPKSYLIRSVGGRVDKIGDKFISLSFVRWFTNLGEPPHHEKLILTKTYNDEDYPKYDGYDIIEVSKTKDIPLDYKGLMGVPLTFMDKWNPDQFEIVREKGIFNNARINGKGLFKRIIIKHKI